MMALDSKVSKIRTMPRTDDHENARPSESEPRKKNPPRITSGGNGKPFLGGMSGQQSGKPSRRSNR